MSQKAINVSIQRYDIRLIGIYERISVQKFKLFKKSESSSNTAWTDFSFCKEAPLSYTVMVILYIFRFYTTAVYVPRVVASTWALEIHNTKTSTTSLLTVWGFFLTLPINQGMTVRHKHMTTHIQLLLPERNSHTQGNKKWVSAATTATAGEE